MFFSFGSTKKQKNKSNTHGWDKGGVAMNLKNKNKLTDVELEQVVGKHLQRSDWDW